MYLEIWKTFSFFPSRLPETWRKWKFLKELKLTEEFTLYGVYTKCINALKIKSNKHLELNDVYYYHGNLTCIHQK